MKRLITFLEESNKIEKEYSIEALHDAGEAWEYAVDKRKNFGIDYVCGIHEKLMHNLNPPIAGKLRRKNVSIYGRDSAGELVLIQRRPAKGNKPRLRKWCKRYISPQSAEEIKEAHIDFEMVHPFMDGNGRVGRIIYNVQRLQLKLPIEVIYEVEKQEYYQWFADRQREEAMIEYFKQLEKLDFKK